MHNIDNAGPTPEQAEMIRLESIFMPYDRRTRERLFDAAGKSSHVRFVHYSSAEAALNIIKTKRLWMRNATCMSDYREMQHGFEMMCNYFRNEFYNKAFFEALELCSPGSGQEAINLFNQWWADIRFNTYITSISEHDDKEDSHGRLSMWRAFGGNEARVAIIFKVPRFSKASAGLNLIFSPIAYLTEKQSHENFLEAVQNIKNNYEFLRSIGGANFFL